MRAKTPPASVAVSAPFGATPRGWSAGAGLAIVASVLAVLWCARGAAFGEAVADDFDFLYYLRLGGAITPWDGGGSLYFWRPLAHQAYFALMGGAILHTPVLVPIVHALVLLACGGLLYRALSTVMPAPAALAAALFPIVSESTRGFLTWGSHSVDLGLLLFSSLALWAVARRHMWPALAALLAALLCKEVAVMTAVMMVALVFMRDRAHRRTWTLAIAAVTLLWLACYGFVARTGHVQPLGVVHASDSIAGQAGHLLWALVGTLRASVSLPLTGGMRASLLMFAYALPVLVAVVLAARSREVRARLAAQRGMMLWGAAWTLIGVGLLAANYAMWAPHRTVIVAVGLGVLLASLLWAAWPPLLGGLVVVKFAALLLAPQAASGISGTPVDNGAFVDFEKLARLQRLMRDTRTALAERFPELPKGARVGMHYFPQRSTYAFSGDRALRVWYADSSLRWVTFSDAKASDEPLATIVEYQPHGSPQVALVRPDAMRARLRGLEQMRASQWSEALGAFREADSLQDDPRARLFRASNAYNRAFCLGALGLLREAESAARDAVASGQVNANARYTLALLLASEGRMTEAQAQLDSVLAEFPTDGDALALRGQLRRR